MIAVPACYSALVREAGLAHCLLPGRVDEAGGLSELARVAEVRELRLRRRKVVGIRAHLARHTAAVAVRLEAAVSRLSVDKMW